MSVWKHLGRGEKLGVENFQRRWLVLQSRLALYMGWLCRSYTMAHKQLIDLIMIPTENPPASQIRIRTTQTSQDIPTSGTIYLEPPPLKPSTSPSNSFNPPTPTPATKWLLFPLGRGVQERGILRQRKSVPLMK